VQVVDERLAVDRVADRLPRGLLGEGRGGRAGLVGDREADDRAAGLDDALPRLDQLDRV
jgi:hypothetical protein